VVLLRLLLPRRFLSSFLPKLMPNGSIAVKATAGRFSIFTKNGGFVMKFQIAASPKPILVIQLPLNASR